MDVFADYITIAEAVLPSRSGLYAVQLPGIDVEMLDCLSREITGTADDIWPTIYKRACDNLVSDISKNLQTNFNVDLKLVSRETSQYKNTENTNPGLAGIKIDFAMPRYARLHVLYLEVFSLLDYGSPGVTFTIYDTDENGEKLFEKTESISRGRSKVFIDHDFQVDKIYITYSTAQADFKATETKVYRGFGVYDSIVCDVCLDSYGLYTGTITQVNGGGINAFYNIRCSVNKYVGENLNLFRQSLLYKIGEEITIERRIGERLTKFTTFTIERAQELSDFYNAQYNDNLSNALKSQDMYEDPVCFICKTTSYVTTQLP
jgi:ribosomal protein L31